MNFRRIILTFLKRISINWYGWFLKRFSFWTKDAIYGELLTNPYFPRGIWRNNLWKNPNRSWVNFRSFANLIGLKFDPDFRHRSPRNFTENSIRNSIINSIRNSWTSTKTSWTRISAEIATEFPLLCEDSPEAGFGILLIFFLSIAWNFPCSRVKNVHVSFPQKPGNQPTTPSEIALRIPLEILFGLLQQTIPSNAICGIYSFIYIFFLL